MKKETLSNFLNELMRDLENTVEENISISELKNKKNILIIRSAKKNFLVDFMDELYKVNKDATISLIGDMTDYDEKIEYALPISNLYVHYSRIDDHFMGELLKIKKMKEVDAIVFLNYEIFRSTYANVSRLADRLATVSGADVYSYQVMEKKFNHYKDMRLFQEGLDNMTGVARMCEMLIDNIM